MVHSKKKNKKNKKKNKNNKEGEKNKKVDVTTSRWWEDKMDDDLWDPKNGETSEPTSAPHEVTGENAQTANEMPQNDAADPAKSDDEQDDLDSGNRDNTKSEIPQGDSEKPSAGVDDGQAAKGKAAASQEGGESSATSSEESNEEEGEKKEEEDSWSPSYRPGDNINSFVDPETGGYYNNMGGRVFGKSSWEGSYPSTYSQSNPSKPASTQEETDEGVEDADDSEEVADEKEAEEQEDAEEVVGKSQETDGTEKKAVSFGPDVSKLGHHVLDEVKEIASRLSKNQALRNNAVDNKDDDEDDDDDDDDDNEDDDNDDVSELPQGDDPAAYNVKEEVPEEVKVATGNDENSIYGKGQNIAMSQINAMNGPGATEKKKKTDEVKKANSDSGLEEKKKKSK
ncbi:uncharacterized protein DDB_G0290685 [Aplysia californica]|uniref:Uncharacterized protein DDB_G0290685 n=1 Tax=Aplysia californica TaxID=6500 RepID=A0ABM0ZWE2_APLCA|nr:uncharacterized protein DDB_G0290685 [Aplysia californica]